MLTFAVAEVLHDMRAEEREDLAVRVVNNLTKAMK